MSNSCYNCKGQSTIELSCIHNYCFPCYYLSYSGYLHKLGTALIDSPKTIPPMSDFGCPHGCQSSKYLASPLILLNAIENQPNLEPKLKCFHQLTVFFCEFYLSGISTTFGQCKLCGFLEINSKPYNICGCKPQFIENLKILKDCYKKILLENTQNEEAKSKANQAKRNKIIRNEEKLIVENPVSLWDELGKMVIRAFGRTNVSLTDYLAMYDKDLFAKFNAKYPIGKKEFVVKKEALSKKQKKISLKMQGSSQCYVILAMITEETRDSITLQENDSYIVTYVLGIS